MKGSLQSENAFAPCVFTQACIAGGECHESQPIERKRGNCFAREEGLRCSRFGWSLIGAGEDQAA